MRAAAPGGLCGETREGSVLRVFWTAVALVVPSVGVLDAGPLGRGTSRRADGVADMIKSGGPFP